MPVKLALLTFISLLKNHLVFQPTYTVVHGRHQHLAEMLCFPTNLGTRVVSTSTWLAEMSSFPTNLPTGGSHQHLVG